MGRGGGLTVVPLDTPMHVDVERSSSLIHKARPPQHPFAPRSRQLWAAVVQADEQAIRAAMDEQVVDWERLKSNLLHAL